MNRRSWWWLAASIAALALVSSVSSVTNGFAYDDVYLLVKNPDRMQTLAALWREFAHTYWPETAGGDGYRPLTIILFRLEWAIGNGSPLAFHVTNVALHAATAIVVFWLACGVLPLGAAWITAALYAVHPVHVEAIANVVGQSELWVALLVSAAVGVFIHGRLAGPLSWRRWVAIGALYAGACLFKEHAIVLPALLLLAEATLVTDKTPLRKRMTALRVPMLCLAVVALTYMLVRSRVVVAGLAGFQPYVVFSALKLSTPDRILTMIGAVPEWVRLFLWPARLMTEYAPPYIDIAQGPGVAQLPGLLMLIGVIGLFAACWRRSPATSFGIGWLVVALLPASNFLVPAGFIIAERTLLLPSVGAMLAVGSAAPWLYAKLEDKRVAQAIAALVLAAAIGLGVARSYTRNPVWRDNEALFRQQVKESPESYRAHFMLGQLLFEKQRKTEGEAHYRHALKLFPYDPVMALGLAEQYRQAGMCEPAIMMYRWLYSIEPRATGGHGGFALCLLYTLKLDEAREQALLSIRYGGNVRDARGVILAAKQARDSLAVRQAGGRLPPHSSSQ
ncbi:MAG TPA: tetratricopeptide repeat protein [Gemmatimonadaceae bacterium]|nr:tetratricopeptide repeat protein [Gemmatimonadaceae bacterium]